MSGSYLLLNGQKIHFLLDAEGVLLLEGGKVAGGNEGVEGTHSCYFRAVTRWESEKREGPAFKSPALHRLKDAPLVFLTQFLLYAAIFSHKLHQTF